MSYDVFVNSSILNCNSGDMIKLNHYLKKNVKDCKIHSDNQLDLIIEEDFDRRHIKAVLKFLKEDKAKPKRDIDE